MVSESKGRLYEVFDEVLTGQVVTHCSELLALVISKKLARRLSTFRKMIPKSLRTLSLPVILDLVCTPAGD